MPHERRPAGSVVQDAGRVILPLPLLFADGDRWGVSVSPGYCLILSNAAMRHKTNV